MPSALAQRAIAIIAGARAQAFDLAGSKPAAGQALDHAAECVVAWINHLVCHPGDLWHQSTRVSSSIFRVSRWTLFDRDKGLHCMRSGRSTQLSNARLGDHCAHARISAVLAGFRCLRQTLLTCVLDCLPDSACGGELSLKQPPKCKKTRRSEVFYDLP
ncbi:hypothetical protein [Xanthomonas bromi]|uniref:hypothetical protein n=1 Tax=Xanthomonas bromi TaxID=56449 RepID=UPI00080B0ED3|nr:hypothetical protein [Xanthomonas bromi]